MASRPAVPDRPDPCDNPRAYKAKRRICRCPACLECARLENKRFDMREATGTTEKLVSAEKSRWIINALRRRNFTMRWLADETGYSTYALREIRKGRSKQCRKTLHDKLVKIHADSLVYGYENPYRYRANHVDKDRFNRMMQGLMLQGYPQKWIAEQLGTTQQHLSDVLNKSWRTVTLDTERKMLNLVREVGNRPGPNNRVRTIAKTRGYQALAMWDDIP